MQRTVFAQRGAALWVSRLEARARSRFLSFCPCRCALRACVNACEFRTVLYSGCVCIRVLVIIFVFHCVALVKQGLTWLRLVLRIMFFLIVHQVCHMLF